MTREVIQLVLPVALKDVFDAIGPTFEAETGHRFELAIMLNPEVPGYIARGNAWSIAASNPRYIEQLTADGGCDPVMHHLGRAPLSMAILGEGISAVTSRVEIAEILTSAQSIAITGGGTSGSQFDHLLTKLRVRDAVDPKVRRLPGGGPMAALLAGQVELAALPLTNVAPIAGVRSAALCSFDLDVHVDLSFCLHEGANTATQEFAVWLLDTSRRDTLRSLGLAESGNGNSGLP